nr:MAG TPA: Recombinase Flp protein N-terminus [Caudoviricetes sp.]
MHFLNVSYNSIMSQSLIFQIDNKIIKELCRY